MASNIDSAEKAFAAASTDAVTKPVVADTKPADSKPVDAAKPAAAPKAAATPSKAAPVKKVAAKNAAPAKTVAAKPVKKSVAKKPAAAKAQPKAATKTISLKTPTVAAKPVAAAKKGLTTMNDTVKKITEDAKTRAESLLGDVNVRAKEAFEKGSKLASEVVEFQKGNLEAIVESGKIAAKHMEVIGSDAAEFGRKSLTEATSQLKAYTAVKSPADFFALYTENAKKAFDSVVSQGSKTSELVVKMANDSFQPISNRMSVAMSKIKSAA